MIIYVLLLPLLTLISHCQEPAPLTESPCCDVKRHGGVRYLLMAEATEEAPGHMDQFGCADGCIYVKEETDEQYCFKDGGLPTECLCEPFRPRPTINSLTKAPMRNCSVNTEMTKNCIIYRCKSTQQMDFEDALSLASNKEYCQPIDENNLDWVEYKEDPDCCLIDDNKIESGHAIEMDGVKFTCSKGNLEASDESLKNKIEDEMEVTEEDSKIGIESYGEICIDINLQDNNDATNNFYKDIFTKIDSSCSDLPPTRSNSSKAQNVFFFDGHQCSSIRTNVSTQTTENLFPDLTSCITACFPACQQPLEIGLKNCTSELLPTTRFFFDQQAKTCKKFVFLGCIWNRNNFESQEECEVICLEGNYGLGDTLMTSTSDNANRGICQDIENRIPILSKLKKEVKETNDMEDTINLSNILDMAKYEIQTQKPVIDQASIGLSNSSSYQIQSAMISSRPSIIQSKLFFGFLWKKLRWASVFSADCVNIIVVIRYFCINNRFNPSVNFNMVCNEVIPNGLIRYYERSFNYGTQTKNLIIVPIRSFFRSKKFLISGGCGRAGNPFTSWPVFFPFCDSDLGNRCTFSGPDTHADEKSETAAHELGHDILWAKSGIIWSWTHKHTSTIFQSVTSSAPIYPPLAGISPGDLDLMYYYNTRPGQPICNQIRVEIQGSLLAEEDAEGLVDKARYKYISHCGGVKCGPCLFGGMCQAGLRCHFFRCVDCTHDSHCSGSQYCWGLYNPFRCNECRSKKVDGAWCLGDRECINYCDGARCTECEEHHHCPSGQYCKNKNIPFVQNKCRAKKNNGAWCLSDAECINYCDGARCTECEHDHHCPPGHVCANKNIPFLLNKCKNSCGRFCLGSGSCRSPCGSCKWTWGGPKCKS